MTEPDPMLSMLEWLCTELMEVEVDQQLGAEKSQRIVSMVVLIVCGVDENGHRISLPLNLWPTNPEAPM